ncbi:hypothetical protein CENSYa_0621 [Cenarchaeum symbiosum A]|uniref:Uncharacterized protein n=1 Tax=Cenarchaeum symbiosum (strain A) TaxID=414004 RepID=A0RV87_CENSY|nr:hypothetical protein CENSYa_0621 [Cenarchaeum symbiosum A]
MSGDHHTSEAEKSELFKMEIRDLSRRTENMSHTYLGFISQDEGCWIRDQLQLKRVWDRGRAFTGVEDDSDIRTDEELEQFRQDIETANQLMCEVAARNPNGNAAKVVKELDHINEALPALVRKTCKVYRATSVNEILTLARGGAVGDGREKRDKDYGQDDNISASVSFAVAKHFAQDLKDKIIMEMDVSALNEGKEWLAQKYDHRPICRRIRDGKPAGAVLQKFGNAHSAASSYFMEVRLKYGAKPKIKRVHIPAKTSPKVVKNLKKELIPLGIKVKEAPD